MVPTAVDYFQLYVLGSLYIRSPVLLSLQEHPILSQTERLGE